MWWVVCTRTEGLASEEITTSCYIYHCSSQCGINTMSPKHKNKKKNKNEIKFKSLEYLRFSPEINTRTKYFLKNPKIFGRIKYIPKAVFGTMQTMACNSKERLTPAHRKKRYHCNKIQNTQMAQIKKDVALQDKEILVCVSVCVLLLAGETLSRAFVPLCEYPLTWSHGLVNLTHWF